MNTFTPLIETSAHHGLGSDGVIGEQPGHLIFREILKVLHSLHQFLMIWR